MRFLSFHQVYELPLRLLKTVAYAIDKAEWVMKEVKVIEKVGGFRKFQSYNSWLWWKGRGGAFPVCSWDSNRKRKVARVGLRGIHEEAGGVISLDGFKTASLR